jgi:type I restriction enzyme S subunit
MKQYEKYKPIRSSVFNEAPVFWNKYRVKDTVDRNTYYPVGDGDHGSIKPEMYQEEGIPYIRVQNLTWHGEILTDGIVCISEEVQLLNKKSNLYPGDILIAKTGATIGKLGLIPEYIKEANTTSSVGKLTVDKTRFNPKYILYCFQSRALQDQIWLEASQKSAQPGFNIDDLIVFEFLAPDLNGQSEIVLFLDHQTAIIDQLIQQKEKLIELLKEKRQAVINEAVTKGLNPNAKMKDSGIEWLGEMPAGWKLKRLRYLGKCQNGVSQGSEYFGSGDPFVSYGDVYKNITLPREVAGLAKSTESDKEAYSVLEGDVFFTRTSETIEEIAFASTCLETITNAVFAGFLIRFRPISNVIDKNFSKYYFRSHIPRIFFVKEMNLVTRASLSQELLKNLPVLLPSLHEQREIASFLDGKIAQFNNLILELNNVILKLKEYRQSIISEAVTGKIDVREWQPNKQLIV